MTHEQRVVSAGSHTSVLIVSPPLKPSIVRLVGRTHRPRVTATFRTTLEVEVREITEDDLAGFRDWYGSDEIARTSLELHRTGKAVYLVGIVRDQLVAHLGVDLTKAHEGVGVLWQLGVRPVLQGHGIGTWLIEIGEDVLRERGLSAVEIGVAKNNVGARRLYERIGYEVVGEGIDRWSYTDPDGERVEVAEDIWTLHKELT